MIERRMSKQMDQNDLQDKRQLKRKREAGEEKRVEGREGGEEKWVEGRKVGREEGSEGQREGGIELGSGLVTTNGPRPERSDRGRAQLYFCFGGGFNGTKE